MVALDQATGRTLWANKDFLDPIGYGSPVPARIDGVEQVISMSAKRIFAIEPIRGELLWETAFANQRGNSATDVVVSDGLVYGATGYGGGSILLRPRRQSNGQFSVEELWRTEF